VGLYVPLLEFNLVESGVWQRFRTKWAICQMAVNGRSVTCEREICGQFVRDDELSAQQRQQQSKDQKDWKKIFAGLRPKLEAVYAKHGVQPLRSFDEAINSQERDGGLISIIAQLLYHHAAHTDASEAAIRKFMEVWPPFRAMVYAGVMAWFDLAVRDRHIGEKFQAGRNDLFMFSYLPYCNIFVTAERKGEQLKCLRKIVEVAKLRTDVMSSNEFAERLRRGQVPIGFSI
jgi:hypothetical protein